MDKPSIPAEEAARIAALKQTRLVETGRQDVFDNLTEIIKDVFGVPIVAISLIEVTRQFFKSIQGLNIVSTTRDVSFCGHVVYQNASMVIPDTALDSRFLDNPLVTGVPYIRFYAGVPIQYEYKDKHYVLGALCIIDTKPRNLDDAGLKLLKKFANQAERIIESCMFNAISINTASPDKSIEIEKLVNDLMNQNKLYKNLSEIDVLTDLPNRRFLTNYLNRYWFNDDRHHFLSILLVDLDGFKQINDNYGHNVGDKVLVDSCKCHEKCAAASG